MVEPSQFVILQKIVSAVIANRHMLSRSKEDIVRDLKFIRFNDDGVLYLIRAALEGKKVPEEEYARALTEFNDYEWGVAAAVERLSTEALRNVKGVSRLTSTEIEQVGRKKVDVRRAIQQELNLFGRRGFKSDKVRLRSIQTNVDEFNSLVD